MNAKLLLLGLAVVIAAGALGVAAEPAPTTTEQASAPAQTTPVVAPLGVCPNGGPGLGLGYGRGAGWGGGRGYGRGYGWGRMSGGQGLGRGPGFVDLNGNGICDRWEQVQTSR